MSEIEQVLHYWFGNIQPDTAPTAEQVKFWFHGDESVDEEIREKFGDTLERAIRGELDHWAETPRGRLALIIVLDQFSRNLFRGSAKSFTQDAKSLKLCLDGIEQGVDAHYHPLEKVFFTLPMQHSEDMEIQKQSVAYYDQLIEDMTPQMRAQMYRFRLMAKRHHDIIKRYGRYPHRNEVLGRTSTQQEIDEYLEPELAFPNLKL